MYSCLVRRSQCSMIASGASQVNKESRKPLEQNNIFGDF